MPRLPLPLWTDRYAPVQAGISKPNKLSVEAVRFQSINHRWESYMVVLKAKFDGKKVVLPRVPHGAPPGEVIVIFPDGAEDEGDWLKAQEAAFANVWDNDEDAAYDDL